MCTIFVNLGTTITVLVAQFDTIILMKRSILSVRLALFLVLASLTSYSFSQVVINEYSASNMNGPTDAFGDREDWVELYNPSGTPFDLTGYYLSDKSGNLLKWQIPSGSVPANGYLLIFASKRNTVQGTELHPSFNLKQTRNEWIILTNPGGVVIDSLRMVNMTKMDHSVGRQTDGAPDWKLFTTPTPGASNVGAVEFYEPKPVMNLAPGFYTGTQNVTITCANPNATIHYTIDGTDPNAGSPVYSGPIALNQTTVVRAIAYDVNPPSFIETNTYLIDETHGVPVVSVCSADLYDLLANGNQGPNDVGSFELFEQDGTFIDEGEGHFNEHGNDSWAYPQRGFDLIMRDQFGYTDGIDHEIFPNDTDRDHFQRLILKPGASDNYPFENGGAHIRDAFVHTLSIRADMLLDERTWRPCVVYLNGEYWGVYEMREKVDDHDYTDYYYDQGSRLVKLEHSLVAWNGRTLKINSVYPPNYPWTTQYYGAINTITIANPEPGFMFDHWEYTVGPMNNAITEDTNGVMLTANDSIIAVFVPSVDDDDGDGVPNDQEAIDGTDPNDPCDYVVASVSIAVTSGADCDGDGFTDANEIQNNTNPFDPCDPDDSDPQCQIDTDGDGVSDLAEASGNTDPNDPCDYNIAAITLPITSNADCDGDGIDDATEVADGTDPFDPCDPNATGVECATGIHVPSAFSPNGDNNNDELMVIVGTDVVNYTIRIYDRWGNLIVESSEPNFAWDGLHNNIECNSGVYAYMLEVVFANGTAELREGNITLLR